jgi:muramoyltetrapeptide carboxypeptidase
MKLIKPERLTKGSTIGIISPSAFLNGEQISRLNTNVAFLKKMGYNIKLGKYIKKRYGHNAGTNEQKLEDLHSMFEDRDVNAILCSRGGYNSNELLDDIDYNLIRRNPKIFSGYSDITFMHLAIHKKTGLVTFYGPNAVTRLVLPGKADDYTYKYFDSVLTGSSDTIKIKPSKSFTYGRTDKDIGKQMPTRWTVLKKGKANGRLVGGHILTILNLLKTGYLPDFKDKILFWEDTESATGMTERFIWQLRMVGVLDQIKGMIIGRTNATEYETFSNDYGIDKVIVDATKGYDFPIMGNMDFGHTTPMFPIPYGINASLDLKDGKKEFSLLEKSVR